MICGDIWHKYHKWYFKIVVRNFTSPSGEWNLRQFWNSTSGIYAKYYVQIMLLFVYTTTRKRFVIFTCRYFKLSWNTTALSQSNCRNFSCSSIIWLIDYHFKCSSVYDRGSDLTTHLFYLVSSFISSEKIEICVAIKKTILWISKFVH